MEGAVPFARPSLDLWVSILPTGGRGLRCSANSERGFSHLRAANAFSPCLAGYLATWSNIRPVRPGTKPDWLTRGQRPWWLRSTSQRGLRLVGVLAASLEYQQGYGPRRRCAPTSML